LILFLLVLALILLLKPDIFQNMRGILRAQPVAADNPVVRGSIIPGKMPGIS
jgi:hypothetical protein